MSNFLSKKILTFDPPEFLGNFSNIEILGQNRPLHPWNLYLTLDFHQICVQCVFWRDLIVLEEIFNFSPPWIFGKNFKYRNFGSKWTFASVESLFVAGFPQNLCQLCILMCSNGSRRNFQFLSKNEFWGIFSNIEIWGQNGPLHPWNPYLMLDCLQWASGDIQWAPGDLQWKPGVLCFASLGSNACRLCDEFPSHPLFSLVVLLVVVMFSPFALHIFYLLAHFKNFDAHLQIN